MSDAVLRKNTADGKSEEERMKEDLYLQSLTYITVDAHKCFIKAYNLLRC